jgi:hypothetical protein
MTDYESRLIAETVWLETWEEMQVDQHLLDLWEKANERDQAINEEVLALVGEGDCEEVF